MKSVEYLVERRYVLLFFLFLFSWIHGVDECIVCDFCFCFTSFTLLFLILSSLIRWVDEFIVCDFLLVLHFSIAPILVSQTFN